MADPINILSLFSGSGMHDEAVCAALRALGFHARVLAYVEREASAAAWLMGRMEAQAVERAPVFAGDLAELADCDLDDMRGRIDLIVASPPCQPYSSAGRRLGNDDERSWGDGDGPLPHTLRIIARVRPALVWFENVPEWVTGGHFREFGEQLSHLGYSIEDPIFLAAEDVGAPHERERVFILCVGDPDEAGRRFDESRRGQDRGIAAGRAGAELAERESRGFGVGGEPSGRDGLAAGCDEELAVAGGAGRERPELGRTSFDTREAARRPVAERRCDVGDGYEPRRSPQGAGQPAQSERGQCVPTFGRDRIPMFPPGRGGDDKSLAAAVGRAAPEASAGILRAAAADYRRWAELAIGGLYTSLMPSVERGVPTLADGLAFSDSDLLRLGGNGVVPLCAAVALVEAVRRLRN